MFLTLALSVLGLCFALAVTGVSVLVWMSWRDHVAHLDPVEEIRERMSREAREDMRAAMKSLRRSRRRGTMDCLVWCRELEGDRGSSS